MTAIVENIAEVILSRLRNIRKANGYAFDVNRALRVDRTTGIYVPQPLDIVLEQPEETDNPELFCPGNPPAVGINASFTINGYSRQLDRDENAIAVTQLAVSENAMMAAIKNAITNKDPAYWHTFEGNAINANFPSDQQFDEPGFDGVTVALLVMFRVSEIDMGALR